VALTETDRLMKEVDEVGVEWKIKKVEAVFFINEGGEKGGGRVREKII
jgi:hypothetical protein